MCWLVKEGFFSQDCHSILVKISSRVHYYVQYGERMCRNDALLSTDHSDMEKECSVLCCCVVNFIFFLFYPSKISDQQSLSFLPTTNPPIHLQDQDAFQNIFLFSSFLCQFTILFLPIYSTLMGLNFRWHNDENIPSCLLSRSSQFIILLI